MGRCSVLSIASGRDGRGKEGKMKEITIAELLRVNILLEKRICDSLTEALVYDGARDQQVRRMVEKTIQSFARSLNILEGKADLYMGATHVPYDRQSSLRILRRDLTPYDVVRAITRIFMIELAGEYGCDEYHLPQNTRKMWVEDVRRIFKYLEPMFMVLDMKKITEEAVAAEYNRMVYGTAEGQEEEMREAEIIKTAKLIKEQLDKGVDSKDIAVICHTLKEMELLKKCLEKEGVPSNILN